MYGYGIFLCSARFAVSRNCWHLFSFVCNYRFTQTVFCTSIYLIRIPRLFKRLLISRPTWKWIILASSVYYLLVNSNIDFQFFLVNIECWCNCKSESFCKLWRPALGLSYTKELLNRSSYFEANSFESGSSEHFILSKCCSLLVSISKVTKWQLKLLLS